MSNVKFCVKKKCLEKEKDGKTKTIIECQQHKKTLILFENDLKPNCIIMSET